MLGYTWRRNDNGGWLLSDMAHNPSSDPSWFELACSSSHGGSSLREEMNTPQRQLTLKWKAINLAARITLWLGASRSAIVLDQAHSRNGTPLSCAARAGNVKVVQWLLLNGALKSVHVKDRVGSSPLDASRIFGPHREVRDMYSRTITMVLNVTVLYHYRLRPNLARRCWTNRLQQSWHDQRAVRCFRFLI